jgi:hypothetical protein
MRNVWPTPKIPKFGHWLKENVPIPVFVPVTVEGWMVVAAFVNGDSVAVTDCMVDTLHHRKD